MIVRQVTLWATADFVVCRRLKTQTIHQCESLNLPARANSCHWQRQQTAQSHNPLRPHCLLLLETSGSRDDHCCTASLTAYPGSNSDLLTSDLTTWHLQEFKPQLLTMSEGFSLILWWRLVQSYAPWVPAFGISCSTHNVNFDRAALHYFWRQHTWITSEKFSGTRWLTSIFGSAINNQAAQKKRPKIAKQQLQLLSALTSLISFRCCGIFLCLCCTAELQSTGGVTMTQPPY